MAVRDSVPYEKSLAFLFEELTLEWDTLKNLLPPERVFSRSALNAWWLCNFNHSYQARVHNRTTKNAGCPYCSNKRALDGFNDLETLHAEVAKLWNFEKNDSKPSDFTPGSGLKVWWISEKCDHTWLSEVRYMVKNPVCPYCMNFRFLEGFNDLQTRYPYVSADWDFSKNSQKPNEVIFNSVKKYWWICSKNHEWEARVDKRTIAKSGCRECYRNSRSSRLETEIRDFIISETSHIVNASDNSVIHPYEIDIFIPDLLLGFEVNGDYWHSDEMIRLSSGVSAFEYHERKESLAKTKVVDLYFIWESDWNTNSELVKTLIRKMLNREKLSEVEEKFLKRFE